MSSFRARTQNALRQYDTLVMFLVFALASGILTNGMWFDPENLVNVVSRVSVVGVLVLAQTLVLLSGQIDMSLGNFLGLFCGVYAVLFLGGQSSPVAFAVALSVILCLGFVNGILASRTTIPSFVITLGTMMIALSMHLYIIGAARYVPQLRDMIYGVLEPIPKARELFPVSLWIGAFVLLYFVLRFTKFGKHLYAVGGSQRTAIITGVSVKTVKFSVYVLSALLVGLASFIYIYKFSFISPSTGGTYLLDSIAAPIIGGVSLFGGRGVLWKALVGAIFLETLTNFLRLAGVNAFVFPAVQATIIAVGVIISILTTPYYLRRRDM